MLVGFLVLAFAPVIYFGHKYRTERVWEKLQEQELQARQRFEQAKAAARARKKAGGGRPGLQADPESTAQELVRLRRENAAARQQIKALHSRLDAMSNSRARVPAEQPLASAKAASQPPAPLAGKSPAQVKELLTSVLKQKGLSALGDDLYKKVLAWARANPQKALSTIAPLVVDQSQPAAVRAGAALVFDENGQIGGVGLAGAVPVLEGAASTDPDPVVRRSAVHALAFMKGELPVRALEKVLRGDDEWGVKMNAAYGLAVRNSPAAVEYLLKTIRDPKEAVTVRAVAAQTLFSAKPRRAFPFFRESLSSKELGYRLSAAKVIGEIVKAGDPEALQALRAVIEKQGESGMVVQAAKKAYNKVAGQEVYLLD